MSLGDRMSLILTTLFRTGWRLELVDDHHAQATVHVHPIHAHDS